MEPLSEPLPGIIFDIKGVVFHFNVAKTLVWASDEEYSRTYYFLSAKRSSTKEVNMWTFIVGPFKLIIGIRK